MKFYEIGEGVKLEGKNGSLKGDCLTMKGARAGYKSSLDRDR